MTMTIEESIDLLNVGEEEMAIVSDPWRRKFAFLKAEKKAKQLIARTVTNVITYDKKSKRKIIHIGLPRRARRKGASASWRRRPQKKPRTRPCGLTARSRRR
jgi:hypothetical protein